MLEKEILKLPDFQRMYKENSKKDSSLNCNLKNEKELYNYIEKLPTIQKLFIVQNLLKEMISIKDRFKENKEKMKEKIESNCYKYFKSTITIKEIFDYCASESPEISLKHILLKNSEQTLYTFEEEKKDFIEMFFLELRNNNSLMLKIINKINEEYYEQLGYFMVHFLYENTISRSFIQEELMIMTYLILEDFVYNKIPNFLTIKDLIKDLNFNKKQSFVYYYLKAFIRKAEVRNYISSILHDDILDLENEKRVLYLDIRKIHEYISDELNENNQINFDNIRKKNSTAELTKADIQKILKGDNFLHKSTLLSSSASEDLNNKYEKGRHSVGLTNSMFNNNSNNNNDYLVPFFKDNNLTLLDLSKLLSQLNVKNKNEIENAYMEYALHLKGEYHKDKGEIFSNTIIANAFKGTKINQDKITIEEIGDIYKSNYEIIIEFIEELFNKINKNINLLPYSIKCMFFILNNLLQKDYRGEEYLTPYLKYIIKLRFFFNTFIIPNIGNPIYNGIVSDGLISITTKENLNVICKILEKFVSGNLFNFTEIDTNDPNYLTYTIFNKFIFDKIPFLFEIINNIDDYIAKNFDPPLSIQNLISSKSKMGNSSRNINYDYFEINKNENIRYESVCFSSSDIMMFVNTLEKMKENSSNKNQKESIYDQLVKYKKIFNEVNKKDKTENKKHYIFISKFLYRESFLKEIKSVTEDHIENYFKLNKKSNIEINEEIPRFKKCLIQILIFINKLHKENFNPFIQRKDELFLLYNSNINKFYDYKKLLLFNDTIFEGEKRYSVNSLSDSLHMKESIKKGLAEDILEDADFLKEIFPRLMSNIKYEIGYNFDNPKLQEIIFCVSYLQIHINNLPSNYAKDNFKKLFMDIMFDIEKLIKSLENNLLNQFYLKIREGDKLNSIMSNYNSQIKSMEKYSYIRYFFNKLDIPNPFNASKSEKTQTSSSHGKSFMLVSDKSNIALFIKKFPDYRKDERENDDIIEEENKKDIPNILKNYFKDIKNKIKEEKISTKFSPFEYSSICYELENYILFRLYDKLYPTIESKKDHFIHKKCSRLSFIKPENYIKDKKMINEKLLQRAIEYINSMDTKYTPVDKITMFGKAFSILQNSMSFTTGQTDLGVDDILPLLIYVVLKSKPKMINTNYNYCKYYINPELDKKQYGMLLMQIGMAITVINDMKHTDFIGVTKEQFGSDKELPKVFRRSNNLKPKYNDN